MEVPPGPRWEPGRPLPCSVVDKRASGVPGLTDETLIYESPNGDRWFLTEAHPERLLVRHQPNLASGGRAAFFEVEDFLAQAPHPQQEALRRLLNQPA